MSLSMAELAASVEGRAGELEIDRSRGAARFASSSARPGAAGRRSSRRRRSRSSVGPAQRRQTTPRAWTSTSVGEAIAIGRSGAPPRSNAATRSRSRGKLHRGSLLFAALGPRALRLLRHGLVYSRPVRPTEIGWSARPLGEPGPEPIEKLSGSAPPASRSVAASTWLLIDPYVTRASLLRCAFGRVEPDHARIATLFPKADAIVLGHTHFDHALDAPGDRAARPARSVFGSRSAANLCRAAGRAGRAQSRSSSPRPERSPSSRRGRAVHPPLLAERALAPRLRARSVARRHRRLRRRAEPDHRLQMRRRLRARDQGLWQDDRPRRERRAHRVGQGRRRRPRARLRRRLDQGRPRAGAR